jgi:hypothetical protein
MSEHLELYEIGRASGQKKNFPWSQSPQNKLKMPLKGMHMLWELKEEGYGRDTSDELES